MQILNSKPSDSGTYYCIAYNPFLKKRVNSTRRVYLIVKKLTEARFSALKGLNFAVTPKPYLTTVRGTNITLECVAQSIHSPNVTWYKLNGSLPEKRHKQIGGNLELIDLKRSDEGTYICSATLSDFSPINTSVVISVQNSPEIVDKLQDKKLIEGQPLSFNCVALGNPKPILTWMLNGNRLTTIEAALKGISLSENDLSRLVIDKVDHRHSGIYQCFASNELGSTYSLARVKVSNLSNEPKDRDDSNDSFGDDFSRKVNEDEDSHLFGHHHREGGKKRNKKNKGVKMVPPTKPEISRISEDSVMVRWDVPPNDGLPISFFKIQYKEISKAKSHWNTLNEDIAPHITSYTVSGLKSGAKYVFRIAAAFSNHDNREGPNSDKFLLLKTPTLEKPSSAPNIINASSESESSIYLTWEHLNTDSVPIEGFFIHYRATSSAGDYHKITVSGASVKNFVISHLAANTAYEIKMQCFNKAGVSTFSNIFVSKTAKGSEDETETTSDNEINIILKDLQPVGSDTDYKFYIILGIAICVSFVVLVVCTIMQCLRVRKVSTQRVEASLPYKITKETNFSSNLNSNLKNVNHNFSNHHAQGYYYSSHHKSVNTISNSISVPSINSSKLNGFKMKERIKEDGISIKDSKDIHIQFNSFRDNTISTQSNGTLKNGNIRCDNISLRSSLSHSALHNKHLYDNNNFNNVHTLDRRRRYNETTHLNHHHHLHHHHHHHRPPPPPPPSHPPHLPPHPSLPLSNHHRLNSRSASFTRLNGTLERKRRSRTDLIAALNTKDNNTALISRCNGLLKTNSSANGSIVIMQSSC